MDKTLQLLIAGCRKGDAQAQRQLFDRTKTRLFAICQRYARDRPEAQDMLQEAFLGLPAQREAARLRRRCPQAPA